MPSLRTIYGQMKHFNYSSSTMEQVNSEHVEHILHWPQRRMSPDHSVRSCTFRARELQRKPIKESNLIISW